jgi:NADH-quinone oxidoreductase subunit F
VAERLVTKHWGTPNGHALDAYLAQGGYESLRRALGMAPEAVTEEVKKSVIRGRGGARFPTGLKWSFVPKNSGKPVYLVVNADEGEPGTFKDRQLMEQTPHMLVEGIAIAAHAIGAKECFVYIRGEYTVPIARVRQALAEAEAAGHLGHVKTVVVIGAGAYICGEETGLLSSIEGKKGHPKLKPPFPAVSGLYKCPTVVNNVETLAYLPHILKAGGEAFAAMGSPKNGGVALYCVSGHVKRPGVLELPMGTTLREMIFGHCGGIRGDRELKAVIPGGSSSAVLTPDQIDVKMDSESLAALGTMLGSAGIVVMDDTTCMVRTCRNIAEFYAHESCGQCTPCREGCDWMARLLRNVEHGRGTPKDLDVVLSICDNMAGKTICVFADGAAMPVSSFVKKFRDEFLEHLEGRCRVGRFPSTAAPAPAH